MVLMIDTRQQEGKHNLKHDYFASIGLDIVRTKLPVGDYQFYGGTVTVDTKANMEEIAANIGGKEHARFREECKLAKKLGAQLVILVENRDGIFSLSDVPRWVNPNPRKVAQSIEGPRLAKAMRTMGERYGVRFMFCTPEEAGQRVLEILENGSR